MATKICEQCVHIGVVSLYFLINIGGIFDNDNFNEDEEFYTRFKKVY